MKHQKSLIAHVVMSATLISCLIGFGARSASADLMIILNDNGGTAPTTTGDGSLLSVMNAAADVWELAFDDSSFDHTLTIDFQWASLGGGVLGVHSLTGQGGMPNRETSANLRFDGDGSTPWFADLTLNGNDPLNSGNSEYGTFTETFQDFGGGTMNSGRVYTDATGDAAGRWDLFSVALHEIGHALGLSSANTSYQDETWTDNDIDVSSLFPFDGSSIPTNNNGVLGDEGFSSNAHLTFGTALMFPSIGSGIRKLPSAGDILANAQLSQFTGPNLSLAAVPEPSAYVLLLVLFAVGGVVIRRRNSPAPIRA